MLLIDFAFGVDPQYCNENDCREGLLRELSPGPLAPEAKIMPLDQAANDAEGPVPASIKIGLPQCFWGVCFLGGGACPKGKKLPTASRAFSKKCLSRI